MNVYLAYRALGAIAPHVPARVGYAIIGVLANAVYRRGNTWVCGLRANIHHAMGASASPDQIDRAARHAFRGLFQNYFDMFRLAGLPPDQLHAMIQVTGWEAMEEARALGRGVLLCSLHLGHTEGGLQVIATAGLPVLAPAEHVQPERLYQYLVDIRTRHGLRLIASDGSMLEVFRALHRNEMIGLALDRDSTGSGVEVTLCGERAHVPDGYARLAAKTRSPIVAGFCLRLPKGHMRAEFGRLFTPDPAASRDEIYSAALDAGVRELEHIITAYPDQWMLTTPIWLADHDVVV